MNAPDGERDYGGEAEVLAHALRADIDRAASTPRARAWVVHLPNIDPDATLLLRFSPPEAAGRLVVEAVLALDGARVRVSDYLSVETLRACRYRRTISLALTRKSSRLAEDIKVRLMPGYIDVLERIRAERRRLGVGNAVRLAQAEGAMRAYAFAHPANGDTLPRLLGSIGLHSAEWRGHRKVALPRLVTGGPHIDVEIGSDQAGSVHLSIRELPLERAQAVLQLICDVR
ncbi:hypothetical protein [Paraburkholderia sp. J67]|uniref:hypothetical protein n=1 Tax=Paraburkholderia sp. J67 TaxID=2805435 RepID=UPI002ABE0958|nr:hypothetical protein [Paraburkholderia sp. J67]